jgi:ABC-type transporter Mla subunit MlaD
VGIFVSLATLLLLAGLAYYAYHTAQRKGWFVTKAPYFVYLRGASGLKVGDTVQLMGFPIGEITKITAAEPYQYDDDGRMVNVYVEFTVRDPYFGYVWSDSVVRVKSSGLLGDRFLEVSKGGTSDSSTFSVGDLLNLPTFAAKLKQPAPNDGVSKYLAGQLSASTKNLLAKYTNGVDLSLQHALVQDLNRIITAKYVYGADRFAGFKVSDEAASLLEDEVEGPDLVRLNRLLLEEYYPSELAKNKPYPTYRESKSHQLQEILARATKQNPVPRGTYKEYHTGDVYWLDVDEPPDLSSQMDAMLRTVKESLPGFLNLTNQLGQVLNNANQAAVHLDDLLVSFKPVMTNTSTTMTNLAAITGTLRETRGALGEWLLPTNIQNELVLLLPNLNSAVTNVNTNLVSLVENLNQSLENLAGITSNLHAQVDANTNILTSISTAIIHTDDLIQGLKRHWLLRSAFKTKPGDSKTNAPPRPPAQWPKGGSQP